MIECTVVGYLRCPVTATALAYGDATDTTDSGGAKVTRRN